MILYLFLTLTYLYILQNIPLVWLYVIPSQRGSIVIDTPFLSVASIYIAKVMESSFLPTKNVEKMEMERERERASAPLTLILVSFFVKVDRDGVK